MNDAAVAEEVEEVETPEVETEEEEAKTPETSEDEAKEPSDSSPEKKKDSVQDRFDELTRKFRTEEREKIALKAEIEELREQIENPPEKPTPDKSLADFDYDEGKYADYLINFARDAAREEAEKTTNSQRQRTAIADFQSKESQFAEEAKDYYAAVHNPQNPVSQAMLDAVQGTENGPAVLYYLAKNPEVAMQLAANPDSLSVAREIGRIEAVELASPGSKQISTAPEPTPKIEAVENPQETKLDSNEGDKLSTEEWMKRRNKQIGKQNG